MKNKKWKTILVKCVCEGGNEKCVECRGKGYYKICYNIDLDYDDESRKFNIKKIKK